MATQKAKVSKTVSTGKQAAKASASTKVNATKTTEHRAGSWALTKTVKVDMPGNGASITVLEKPDNTVYSKLEQASKLAMYRKLSVLKGATIGKALEAIEGLTKGQLKRFAQWGYIKFGKAA